MPKTTIILTTCPTQAESEALVRTLLEERLIACGNIIPGVRSLYHWEEKVEESSEVLLLLKSSPEKLETLEKRLYELHSYDTPEFVALAPEKVGIGYENWLIESLGI